MTEITGHGLCRGAARTHSQQKRSRTQGGRGIGKHTGKHREAEHRGFGG